MSDPGEIHIRSFGVVFALDRRLHRIDRWRLPLPYGLPLRSIGYAAVAVIVVLVVGRLPVLGAVLGTLPVPVRLALLPAGIAYTLTSLKIDGRSAHEALFGLALWWSGPRVLAGWRRRAEVESSVRFRDLTVAPDGRGPQLRPGVVRGAVVASYRYPAEVAQQGRTLVVRQRDRRPLDEGFEVAFDGRHRMVIR